MAKDCNARWSSKVAISRPLRRVIGAPIFEVKGMTHFTPILVRRTNVFASNPGHNRAACLAGNDRLLWPNRFSIGSGSVKKDLNEGVSKQAKASMMSNCDTRFAVE
jgi:hypothetical protein